MRILVWGLVLLGLSLSHLVTPEDLGQQIGADEFATYRFYGLVALAVLVVTEGILALVTRPKVVVEQTATLPTETSAAEIGRLKAESVELRETIRELEARIRKEQEAKSQAGESKGDQEVMNFVSLLQAKGRLVDFLMDDIAKYSDAQIGAAARVVHQGCSQVMKDYFDIQPVAQESQEGDTLTIDKDYDPQRFKLLGKVTGEPPFSGKILHRGWHTADIRLPAATARSATEARVIAPAEVEIH